MKETAEIIEATEAANAAEEACRKARETSSTETAILQSGIAAGSAFRAWECASRIMRDAGTTLDKEELPNYFEEAAKAMREAARAANHAAEATLRAAELQNAR